MLWKSSSCEKVAAIEGNVFWKNSGSKKVTLQEIVDNAEYYFSEKLAFFKLNSSEKVDIVYKYLFRKSICSVDAFILNNVFSKKETLHKSNCPKEVPILRKWLLGRSVVLK